MNETIKSIIMMIEKGNTNEEIISERVNFFKSDEYRKSKENAIFEKEKLFGTGIVIDDSNNVIFQDGFIDNDMVITHRSGYIDWCGGYYLDYSVLNYLLDYIRNNIETIKLESISEKSIMGLVRKYFDKSSDSKYYDVIETLENFYNENSNVIGYANAQLFVRYELPEIICSYNASNYSGSINDFAKEYYLEKLVDSSYQNVNIGFDENKLFTTLPISELRGTNAVACTEYSMLLQNFLAFLGYDIYLIGGKVNGGGHNYNVIRIGDEYKIIDVGQLVNEIIPGIERPYDLLTYGEFSTFNRRKKEMHYESEFQNETLDIEKRR